MANPEHLEILRQGVEVWNRWRIDSPDIEPVLSGETFLEGRFEGINFSGTKLNYCYLIAAILDEANLRGARFVRSNLSRASLRSADLTKANLQHSTLLSADLNNAVLEKADVRDANLRNSNLHKTNLSGSDLSWTNLQRTNLAYANCTRAKLNFTNFDGARLDRANFTSSQMYGALFSDNDLSSVEGLEYVQHRGPSTVGINTLYQSNGQIPKAFLHGCGVPESLIDQIPALVTAVQPIQFYSCFISYSGHDEEFAKRLHSRMREAELRVWFAPEDMKGGDKLYDQIDQAIQVHDRLLLVLSESSMRSPWVETEIRRAWRVELREGRRKLFPIRLVSYEALQEWVCIDSATSEDLAEEVRSYFIPDFSNWKNHDDFEQAFARLLADLKASA